MGEHRIESGDRSQSRALAILVLSAALIIGTTVVMVTGSVVSGLLYGALTGVCVVVAHLMITPGPAAGRVHSAGERVRSLRRSHLRGTRTVRDGGKHSVA
jgi:ABC-type lipoprotein release transport system permease subunit